MGRVRVRLSDPVRPAIRRVVTSSPHEAILP